MSLPTDLTREIADRAQQPGFDVVLDRARQGRRRRRTTIASGLAAAVVVVGVGLAVGGLPGSDGGTPEPAPPGRTENWDGASEVDERLPGAVQSLLRDGRVDVSSIAGSPDGIAVLHRSCVDDQPCRLVLAIEAGDDLVGRVAGTDWADLISVPGGWLLDESFLRRLTSTGEPEDLYLSGPGDGDVMAGDTFVQTHTQGSVLLRGTKLIPAPRPSGGGTHNGYVTPDGRLVAVTLASSGPGMALLTTEDGRTWEDETMTRSTGMMDTAVVAGSGDHVAVAVVGDDADGSIPVVDVLVSHDAGATWSRPAGLDLSGADGVRDLSSLAVSPSGTTYLTTSSQGLVRIDTDGDATAMPLSSHDHSAFVLGEDICVVAEAGRVDELRCSEDDGATWTPRPLPGFR